MKNHAISIKGLTVKYGNNTALSDINLNVKEKDFVGIIGPNGGGKSTFLKAILGLVPHASGTVSIFGSPREQSTTKIGYVPQFALMDKLFPITVKEVVLTGFLPGKVIPFHKYSKEDIDAANQILDSMGISHLVNRQISELSGGEFQKMLISRALARRPKILLLDEPTASIDITSRNQIFSLLDILAESITIMFVTHDLLAVSSHVKSLACLNTTLVYHGSPELTDDVVENLYGCPVDLIAHGVPHRVLKSHNGEELSDD